MTDRVKPIFVVPLPLFDITSPNEAPGYAGANVGRFKAAGVVYRSSGAGSVTLRGNFGGSGTVEPDIDFVALLGTNATAATTARLKLGSTPSETTSNPAYDSLPQLIRSPAPAAERQDGLSHWHFPLPSLQAAGPNNRFWEIAITNHTGDFEASMLVIGKRVQSGRFYNQGEQFGAQDLGSLEIGNWGVLEDTGGKVVPTIDFTLAWETEAKFETEFRPIMQRGQREMLYCCFDPADTAYRQARTFFGVLRRPLVATGARKPGVYSQDFSITSLI